MDLEAGTSGYRRTGLGIPEIVSRLIGNLKTVTDKLGVNFKELKES